MKRFFSIIFLLFLGFSFLSAPLVAGSSSVEKANTEAESATIYFFDDRLCPVCAEAKEFIKELEKNNPNIDLKIHPISDVKKLKSVARDYGVEDYKIMSPTIFIGENFFQFRDFTSKQKEMIERAVEGEVVESDCCLISIPFLDIEVDIGDWSLIAISIILGLIDGLNICSVGALVLILSIVLALDSKKKIFFYGGLFILTSVLIYGGLVFIWGKLFEALIGQLEILRIIVGLAALAGGIYFLKEFWRFFRFGPTCQVSKSSLMSNATDRLKKVFQKPKQGLLLLTGAVISFAGIVTLVELPCSVGLPIAFSAILIEAEVSTYQYIGYILVFLLFYALDELIILTGAVLTKKIWFANSKLITWVTFAGALVLLYLAFHYLFG